MEAIRYLMGGALTWAIAFSLLGSTFILGMWLLGPPQNDRAASFLFIAGGAVTLVLILAVIGVGIAAFNYAGR